MTKQLYVKEFVWFVPNDDNRIADGMALRDEFLREQGIDDVDRNWYDIGCSMLEMLIALSRQASFEDLNERTPGEWFGIFLQNMGLDRYNDRDYSDSLAQDVDEKLDLVIYRNYNKDGTGGIFPLKNPRDDQRKIELWYQMSAYLLENTSL